MFFPTMFMHVYFIVVNPLLFSRNSVEFPSSKLCYLKAKISLTFLSLVGERREQAEAIHIYENEYCGVLGW
jgi:hypothetical protein